MSTQDPIDLARAALIADPTRGQHWVLYVDALVHAGDLSEARKVMDLARRKGLAGVDLDRITRLMATPAPRPSIAPQELQPTSKEADNLLALLNASRISELEQQAREMTHRYPQFELGWTMLGAAFTLQNRPDDALEPMRKAVTLAPGNAKAHNNLGRTFNQLGHYPEAETALRTAISIRPGLTEALFHLGVSLQGQGRSAEAETSFKEYLRSNPKDAEALTNLGISIQEQGRSSEAEDHFRRAIALKPDLPNAHHSLGIVLQGQGRSSLAEKSYLNAVRLAPQNPDTYANLGEVLRALGRRTEASQCLQKAIGLQPDNAALWLSLGNIQAELHQLVEAERCYRRNLQLLPNDFKVQTNLANILASLGKFDEAYEDFQQAVRQNAQDPGSFHGLAFCANYHPDKSVDDVYAAYEAFEAQFGAPLRAQWQALHNVPLSSSTGTRRLRVGYVSPDLREHSVRHFLEPLLASHDRTRFEVFAYAELAREDAATARYRTYCDHFILTRGMSDEALAERIRADAIDVLVDVAGHTVGNRLLVFARKPAPVSLSWLGYGYTTGLKAIDYLLTDQVSAPVGSEHLFSEAPWRLPSTPYVYRPDPAMGEVSALPALAHGFVTFGTLTRAIRINHRTVRVWAEILKRVPGSRLVIDSKNFQHASMQEDMAQRFAQHGIERERLLIGCHSPPWDTLRAMDIGLDCFPHNSGTTLFETLYMGVPFITLAGRPSVGRLGKSILTGLERPQWVEAWCADSEQEYIDKAVALASDLQALAQVRAELRPHMQASLLMDENGFARNVEVTYSQMFERCVRREGAVR